MIHYLCWHLLNLPQLSTQHFQDFHLKKHKKKKEAPKSIEQKQKNIRTRTPKQKHSLPLFAFVFFFFSSASEIRSGSRCFVYYVSTGN